MDQAFGRYRLRGLVGAGGMGQVYRAFDTELHRQVAIKVLPPQTGTDPAFEQRFRREARIAAGLSEPHVVPIHDSGEIEGRLFIAMQLIEGSDVATLLAEQGRLAPARAVHIVEQAAAALDAAHRAGLVHRDVKPANLLVTANDFVYLIDFGIARAPGETQFTQPGAVIGTLPYLAPERFTAGTADHRADIYALACVLHECLTGAKPFPEISLEQQMFAHIQAPRPRPSLAAPHIPPALDAVVATGMAVDPGHRYPTARALAAAARSALAPARTEPDAGVAAFVPAAPPAPRKRGRRGWIIALAATAAVVGLAGIAAFTYQSSSSHDGPPTVTATISVGKMPNGLAVDPTTHTAYVTNGSQDTVSVINTSTNTVTATIPAGNWPWGVALEPTTHTLYAANFRDNSVSVIDTTTNTVSTTIPVDHFPRGVAVDPATHTAYTANFTSDDVSVINTATNTVTATLPVGKNPHGVAVDPTDHTAYVSNTEDASVSVINTATNTVTAKIRVGKNPSGVAVDLTTHITYVALKDDNAIAVIHTNYVSATIPVGKAPDGVAVDPTTHTAYVANTADASVSVIDTTSDVVTATITVGKNPNAVAVDSVTHTVYVTNSNDNTVSVINRQ